jgi:hypothetical protein
MIGKLEQIHLRELWKHETYDFSKWLFDNIDILNEQLGLSISPIEKEKSVGPFSVDIWAEDSSGRTVIIENQLERTNHDHLGKLLTYLSNLDAKIAIWITNNPRPEHMTAINYLNEVVPKDTHFYLIKLQAFRIGESDAAPQFTIVAGPSEEISAGGDVKKESAERDKIRFEFFEQLLEKANQQTNIFNSVSPVGYQGWVNTGAGKAGLLWMLTGMKKASRVELFLNHSDGDINTSRFNSLLKKKEDVEKVFSGELTWDFNDNRKQQYIRSIIAIGGVGNREKWSEIHEDMIDRLVRLEKALRPHIQSF